MALIGKFAGILTLNANPFIRGMAAAGRRTAAFADTVAGASRRIAAFGTAIALPALGFAVKKAGDAQETINKFGQVFKEQTAAANQFADNLSRAVGRSSFAIKDGLASFQGFFVGLGFGKEQSRGFAQELQRLSIDFASFQNISDTEALERFISALSGSIEVMDRFGINLRQTAVQQELLRQGIARTWTQITEQEKAVARLTLIMKAMGAQGAIGDAVRTAGSFVNQLKRLKANVEALTIQIGQALLPAATAVIEKINSMSGTISTFIGTMKNLVERNWELIATVTKLVAGFAAFMYVAPKIITAIKAIAAATAALAAVNLAGFIASLASLPGLVVATVGAAVVSIGAGIAAITLKAEREIAVAKKISDEAESMRMRKDALARKDQKVAAVVAATAKAFDDQAKAIEKARMEHERFITQASARIVEQNLTPLEKWSQGMRELNAVYRAGLLTMEQWGREAARLKNELAENWLSPAAQKVKDFAESIRDSMRTPFEKAKIELDQMRQAVSEGFLDPTFMGRRLTQMADELGFTNRKVEFGTAEQIIRGNVAVGAFNRGGGQKNADTEAPKQTDILKRMLEVLDGIQYARAS